jgi:hypothetical protein
MQPPQPTISDVLHSSLRQSLAYIIGKSVKDYYWNLSDVDMFSLLTKVYERYNPTKLKMVPYILSEYKHQELVLLRDLCERYKLTEDDMQGYVNRAEKVGRHRLSNSPRHFHHKPPRVNLGKTGRLGEIIESQEDFQRRLYSAEERFDRRLRYLNGDDDVYSTDSLFEDGDAELPASEIHRIKLHNELTTASVAFLPTPGEVKIKRYRIREKWLQMFPSLSKDSQQHSPAAAVSMHRRDSAHGGVLTSVMEYSSPIPLAGRRWRPSKAQEELLLGGCTTPPSQELEDDQEHEDAPPAADAGGPIVPLVKLEDPAYWTTPSHLRERFIDKKVYTTYKPQSDILVKGMKSANTSLVVEEQKGGLERSKSVSEQVDQLRDTTAPLFCNIKTVVPPSNSPKLNHRQSPERLDQSSSDKKFVCQPRISPEKSSNSSRVDKQKDLKKELYSEMPQELAYDKRGVVFAETGNLALEDTSDCNDHIISKDLLNQGQISKDAIVKFMPCKSESQSCVVPHNIQTLTQQSIRVPRIIESSSFASKSSFSVSSVDVPIQKVNTLLFTFTNSYYDRTLWCCNVYVL